MRELTPIQEVKIKLLYQDSIIPTKSREGDAGFDVYALKSVLIWPQRWYKFPLGFAMEIPQGWVAMVSERSGMAANKALFTIGNIIDSTYRGEVHAIVYNGDEANRWQINVGDKIAQILVIPCYTGINLRVMKRLSETDRGDKGFGSSDVEDKR
jgi:dUTP pyrophosphatase